MKLKNETHPWEVEALVLKARLYIERMSKIDPSETEYSLFSAFSLEFLARASLAKISPALLADEKNWRNLAFALGIRPTAKKFTPSSIGIKEVLIRLSELEPKVHQEVMEFCTSHFERRNGEVHSGELAFHGYGSSAWLPKFYLAAKTFIDCLDMSLGDFFDDPKHVLEIIESLNDKAAQQVRGEIEAYQTVWTRKSEAERQHLMQSGAVWATRQTGHRVVCPACDSSALIHGTGTGPVQTRIEDDEIEQKQVNIPSSFECIACGLRIAGFSKLAACGLGNAFTATTRYQPSEYFGLYTEEDLESAVNDAESDMRSRLSYEPDYND